MKKIVVANMVVFLLGGAASAQEASKQTGTEEKKNAKNIFPELQGMWYGAREKVTVEVKGNEVIVVENNSKASFPNHQGLRPGLVIARLGEPNLIRGQYVFPGECWTSGGGKPAFSLQNCTEAAYAFHEIRGMKPFWHFNVASMMMLRKDKVAEFSPK